MKSTGKFAATIIFVIYTTFVPSAYTWADQSGAEQRMHVFVEAVASDQLSLDISFGQSADRKVMHLLVTDSVVKDTLKTLHKGDQVQVVYSSDKTPGVLKAVTIDTWATALYSRTWILVASAVLCFVLYGILSGFKPWQLMIGEDNRYSNSKFQITVWFFALISTYIATLWLRVVWAGWDFIGGVSIPQNLLLLSGMSALTFGGAKAITTSKSDTEIAAGNRDPKNIVVAKPNFIFDLTHNDGKPAIGGQPPVPPQLDFGDVQMLIVTLIAVATYLVLVFNFLGTIEYSKIVNLPDVDTTILATFGLGQGAYLTKKAVGNLSTS